MLFFINHFIKNKTGLYEHKDLIMFDSLEKKGTTLFEKRDWYEHSQCFKSSLEHIKRLHNKEVLEMRNAIERIEDKSGVTTLSDCEALNPGFDESVYYSGFQRVVSKWEKFSIVTIEDIRNEFLTIQGVALNLHKGHIDETRVSSTITSIKNALETYSCGLSNLELNALESFVQTNPSAAFILAQPHLISIVGLSLFSEARKALEVNGVFEDIISELVKKKRTSTYFISTNLGLYNPLFLKNIQTIKTTAFKGLRFTRNILLTISATAIPAFGYQVIKGIDKTSTSDIFNACVKSRNGFENETIDAIVDGVGKVAFELGKMASAVTSNAIIGYVKSHSLGITTLLKYIEESRK